MKRGYEVAYRNVKQSAAYLAEMLKLSKGVREVPLIFDQGSVSVGWEGGT